MKLALKALPICIATLIACCPNLASAAPAKCTNLQAKNYMLPGKCVLKTAIKPALKVFTTKGCAVCHGKTSVACPFDLGDGSCTFKKMAQLVKAANDTAGNKKSVPTSILIDQFNAYAAFMPGIAAPSAADAKKYLLYLSTLKQ